MAYGGSSLTNKRPTRYFATWSDIRSLSCQDNGVYTDEMATCGVHSNVYPALYLLFHHHTVGSSIKFNYTSDIPGGRCFDNSLFTHLVELLEGDSGSISSGN
jgi:hypothetical protein